MKLQMYRLLHIEVSFKPQYEGFVLGDGVIIFDWRHDKLFKNQK